MALTKYLWQTSHRRKGWHAGGKVQGQLELQRRRRKRRKKVSFVSRQFLYYNVFVKFRVGIIMTVCRVEKYSSHLSFLRQFLEN